MANIYSSVAKFVSSQSGGSSYEQQKNVSPLNSRRYSASTSTGGTLQNTSREQHCLVLCAGALPTRLAHTNAYNVVHPPHIIYVTKTLESVFKDPGKIHTNRENRMPLGKRSNARESGTPTTR